MTVHGLGESQAVDGMNQGKTLGGLHLVPLEMTNEVPTYWRLDRGHLAHRFLNAVFTNVTESCADRGFDRVGSVRLSDRDDGDLLAVSAAADRVSHSLSNLGQTVRQVLKWHNARKYQGLHVRSRETSWPLFRAESSRRRGQSSSRATYSLTGSIEGFGLPIG